MKVKQGPYEEMLSPAVWWVCKECDAFYTGPVEFADAAVDSHVCAGQKPHRGLPDALPQFFSRPGRYRKGLSSAESI